MRSPRNKTIDLSLTEGRQYLDRCRKIDGPVTEADVLDSIILGDAFAALPHLPRACADLLIAVERLVKRVEDYQIEVTVNSLR